MTFAPVIPTTIGRRDLVLTERCRIGTAFQSGVPSLTLGMTSLLGWSAP